MSDLTNLVLAAKSDDAMFSTLFAKFAPGLEKKADQMARRNPGNTAHDFLSAYGYQFWKVVKDYNPERGEFEHMLNNALRMANAAVIRKEMNNLETPSQLCDPTIMERDDTPYDATAFINSAYGEQLTVPSTEDVVEADNSASELEKELRHAGASEDDIKAAILLSVGGYTDLEIARACGHDGSDKAAGMWMVRLKQRVGRILTHVA